MSPVETLPTSLTSGSYGDRLPEERDQGWTPEVERLGNKVTIDEFRRRTGLRAPRSQMENR